MKYIIYPFWSIWVIIFTLIELLMFVIYNLVRFLWEFKKPKHFLNWSYWTEKYNYFDENTCYDKNPIETMVRYINFGECKNKR